MKWVKHLTPLLIAAMALVVILITYLLGNNAAEVKGSVAAITLPVAAGCMVADVIVKKSLRYKLLWIWITEIILLLAVVYLWIVAE